MDFLSNQILLPLGGIFIAIFVGWIMKKEKVLEELEIKNELIIKVWFFFLKYIAPLTIVMIFVEGLT